MRLLLLLGFLLTVAAPGLAAGPDPSPVSGEVARHVREARTLGLFVPADGDPLSPTLRRLSREEPRTPVLVWVRLTDKGVGTAQGYATARGAVAASWSDRVRARREAAGSPRADFSDLPVHRPYVERLERAGFRVRRVSRWLNAVSVDADAGRLGALAEKPWVRSVKPVLTRREPLPERDPALRNRVAAPVNVRYEFDPVLLSMTTAEELAHYGQSFNQLDQVQALDLHRLGYTGAGVRVMVLDTGFLRSHRAFACTKVVAEYDFVQEDAVTANEPGDSGGQHNHGTGVWAVVGGYEPGYLVGAAFGAEYVLAKTENVSSELRAEEDNYVAALEWGDTLGVDVATASLGYFDFDNETPYTEADKDGDTSVITVAIDLAVAKGMTCVNSLGNNGSTPGSLNFPADADSVISVGAVDSTGTVAGFSSRGPTADGRIKPEICARGVATHWAQAWSGYYGSANGTSLSAPIVAGLAALIKEARPGWDGTRIREALMNTGSQAGSPDNTLGWGIARVLDAVQDDPAPPAPPRAPLPFAALAPSDGAAVATTSPTFTWETAATEGGPATYQLVLAPDSAFTVPDTVDTGIDTTWTQALPAGSERWWRVEAVNDAGYVRKSGIARKVIVAEPTAVPDILPATALAVSPNPSRNATNVRYAFPGGGPGRVTIFDAAGRVVRTAPLAGARGEWVWDGRDAAGRSVPTGLYFVRIDQGNTRAVRKLVRIS